MEKLENGDRRQFEILVSELRESVLAARKTPWCSLYLLAKEFGGVRVGHETEDQPIADRVNRIAQHPDVLALMNAEIVLFHLQEELKRLKS